MPEKSVQRPSCPPASSRPDEISTEYILFRLGSQNVQSVWRKPDKTASSSTA